NILPDDREPFARQLQAVNATSAPLYPVIPGRLTHINEQPVRQLVSKESTGERAVQRDLSLTWAADLPQGNALSAGRWWAAPPPADGVPGVSVEAELAQSLKLELGDLLTFDIGGQQRQARVSSLRTVHWDSFQPNFYMIFQPGTLQGLPATYLTSFYLAPGHDQEV